MDWFPKDLQNILEEVTLQTDQLVSDVIKTLDQAALEIDQSLDDLIDPLVVEIEKGLDDLLEPVMVDIVAFDQALEEFAAPLTQRLSPLFDQQPACIGCRHYHGKTYGEHFLVCGMHPYGAPADSCPDWESC
ncbi:hypothetical protein [Acaryochloris sp. IP29b_bin.148]|uniref:hypothetical protein n=1 Tax=Acaryochloris sp. IP29b_bin.148 TaxID=2969218 RepID=UPI002632E72B|nr:hypothetical protein [Acaryochloris sp. IP29b_bin.148]